MYITAEIQLNAEISPKVDLVYLGLFGGNQQSGYFYKFTQQKTIKMYVRSLNQRVTHIKQLSYNSTNIIVVVEMLWSILKNVTIISETTAENEKQTM